MSATTFVGPVSSGGSRTHPARLALAALAVILLLAITFVIGRATVSTTHVTARVTPATAPVSVHTTAPVCRMGRPC